MCLRAGERSRDRRAAERRRGKRQSGAVKVRSRKRTARVRRPPCAPLGARCALLARVSWPAGREASRRRWPSKYYLGHLCASAKEHEIVDIPPF